ncbi:MAG: hypothetical protein U5K54_21690 [Cytophagales bacterium]|nr:hypothetical protein [Cytophagales bacterium]
MICFLNPRIILIDQSLSSRSAETPTNGDGFGIGWYGNWKFPGVFRSIRPAWNDFNLRDLALSIESKIFMAHVRATSLATVQRPTAIPSAITTGCLYTMEKSLRWKNSGENC